MDAPDRAAAIASVVDSRPVTAAAALAAAPHEPNAPCDAATNAPIFGQHAPVSPRVLSTIDAATAHLWAAVELGDARRVHELVVRWSELTRVQHIARHLASPVHLAAAGGHLDVLRVLAAAGANLSATDAMQATPLHYAAEHGQVAAIEWLLRREANVAAVDLLGCSPLHTAVRAGRVECVRALVKAMSVNAQNAAVWTSPGLFTLW